MKISIKDFKEGGPIPKDFTCDGSDRMPDITIEGIPEGAKSLALIVDDPDAPSGLFTHCILYNIPPSVKVIDSSTLAQHGVLKGINDFGNPGYGGPCPPPGKPHRYYFKLYALDTALDKDRARRKDFDKMVKGHVIDQCQYMGTYLRKV